MLEKLKDIETEREIIGKLLYDPDSFARLDRLQDKHFADPKHRVIYSGEHIVLFSDTVAIYRNIYYISFVDCRIFLL